MVKKAIWLAVAAFGWSATWPVSSAAAQEAGNGLVAVKITVADFDRTTRFYAVLGMIPGTTYNDHERELRWPSGGRGSSVIMVTSPSEQSAARHEAAFLMISVTDVPATVQRLRASGFEIEGRLIKVPQATIIVIRDPDGNGVELVGGPVG